MDSILNSIKKLLGITEEYEHFDQDIIIHINSVFSILRQIGVGPEEGFVIKDNTSTWDEFAGDDIEIESVKTYVYLKVRLIFDPPSSSASIDAIKENIKEIEWRLNVFKDTEERS